MKTQGCSTIRSLIETFSATSFCRIAVGNLTNMLQASGNFWQTLDSALDLGHLYKLTGAVIFLMECWLRDIDHLQRLVKYPPQVNPRYFIQTGAYGAS